MKKKIRIALIITRLDRGGSADAVLQLAAGLNKSDFTVKIISGRTQQPTSLLANNREFNDLDIEYIDCLIRALKPIQDFFAFIKIRNSLINFKPDIVHTNSSKAGILGRLAAAGLRIPLVVHSPHGHIFYGYYNKFISYLFILLEKWISRYTHIIFTLTEMGKKDHLKFRIARSEKFVVNPVGIDLSKFRGKEVHSVDGVFTIAWVGRLDPVKDCRTFIDSLKILKERGFSFRALIAGDGEQKEWLQHYISEVNLSEVIFMGFIENPVEVYGQAHLFVLSSINEGFGRVIIEAMACGLPVVATAVGGVPEIIQPGKNGSLVQPGNCVEMADAIMNFLQDDYLCQKVGEENKKRAEYYSLDNYITTTSRIYKSHWGWNESHL